MTRLISFMAVLPRDPDFFSFILSFIDPFSSFLTQAG